jgi:hypothetical protein
MTFRTPPQFIEVHKQYDSTTAGVIRPAADIINDIVKMEAEEKQLRIRLQREQAQVSGNSNFQRLFAESSEMRQAQDEEIRLEGQKCDQLHSFASAKQRLKQSERILDLMTKCEGKTIEIVLGQLDHEFDLAVDHLEAIILPQQRKLEVMRLQAEKESVSNNNMADIEALTAQLEETLRRKQHELDNLGGIGNKVAELKRVSTRTKVQ